MINGSCRECIFWAERGAYGECRRFPPVVAISRAPRESHLPLNTFETLSETVFPVTVDFQWCGEFKAKEPSQ